MTNGINALSECLGCRAALPAPFLDLGQTPLANSYLPPDAADEAEEKLPLAVAYCSYCHLVQLTRTVAPARLFSRYAYFSSYSESFLAHAQAMAASYVQRFALGHDRRVLELASNDGYLLQFFSQRGISVLGVEPAANIAAAARARGIPTLECFFDLATAPEVIATFGRAHLVVGNNVLAHAPSVNAFLAGVAACLERDGAAAFEFPYLRDLLDRVEFDTIYHEHVFYYSLTAIDLLARRAGLELFDAVRTPVHGGSLRVFLQHPGTRPVGVAVVAILREEREVGLTDPEIFSSFGTRVERLRHDLRALLCRLKRAGKRIAAYGAPAKGNTLLNYCEIGSDLIEFTVDRSPHKQGKLLPGSRLPICEPQRLLAAMPDYTLILPWNIADEIVEQQQAYVRAGGRFIVPVPHPHVLEPENLSLPQASTVRHDG